MIRDDHPVEAATDVTTERLDHVDIALVDEHLRVVRYVTADVAEVDVADLAGSREALDRLVDIDVGHLGDRPLAELEHVRGARDDVEDALQPVRVRRDPRRAPEPSHRWIVRVDRELHPCLLGHWDDRVQEVGDAAPHLVFTHFAEGLALARPGVVDHVPDHPPGDLGLGRGLGAVEANRLGPSASEGPDGVTPDGREGEVVPHDRYPGLADVPDQSLQALELLLLPGPVEKDVVPVADLEVLEGRKLEPLRLDGAAKLDELLDGPDVEARRDPPAVRHGLRVRDPRAARHVVDEMGDDRLGARLPGEPEVLRRQHLLVEPQPRFHPYLLVASPSGSHTGRAPSRRPPRVGLFLF